MNPEQPTTTHEHTASKEITHQQYMCIVAAMHDVLADFQHHLTHGNIPADEELRDAILERLALDHADRLCVWLQHGIFPPADEELMPVIQTYKPKSVADYRLQAAAQALLQMT